MSGAQTKPFYTKNVEGGGGVCSLGRLLCKTTYHFAVIFHYVYLLSMKRGGGGSNPCVLVQRGGGWRVPRDPVANDPSNCGKGMKIDEECDWPRSYVIGEALERILILISYVSLISCSVCIQNYSLLLPFYSQRSIKIDFKNEEIILVFSNLDFVVVSGVV